VPGVQEEPETVSVQQDIQLYYRDRMNINIMNWCLLEV
jgi:hypothetical protein